MRHGQKDHLICSGAKDYDCWNGITVDGPLAAGKLITAIRSAIMALPDFDAVLLRQVQEEWELRQSARGGQRENLTRRLAEIQRGIENLVTAIRATGHSPSLVRELANLEEEKNGLTRKVELLKIESDRPVSLPDINKIRAQTNESFENVAVRSPEFGRLLRRLIPRIVVHPHRLCDGGHPVLRARFTLGLAPLLPEAAGLNGLTKALERSLIVDLFEQPQRSKAFSFVRAGDGYEYRCSETGIFFSARRALGG